jgi:hypothetical protein
MSIEFGTLPLASRRGAHTAPVIRKTVENSAHPATPVAVDFGAVFQQQMAPAATAAPPATGTPANTGAPAATGAPPNATAPRSPVASAPASLTEALAALPNGGLMSNPTGCNALNGGTIAYNPNYYATLAAATEVAQRIGGKVVDMRGQISNNQSEYYIDLPNGTSINAGNLVAICNNPIYKGNAGVMDHMLAEILNNNAIGTTGVGTGQYTVKNGQVTYDPHTQVATPPSPYCT